MITLEDMQTALAKAHTEKTEVQARLRMAAAELVNSYRESLGVSEEQSKSAVTTGVTKHANFVSMPVAMMEIDINRTLEFFLTTTIQNVRPSKFVISVSISMREKDEFISVRIENDAVPVLVLKEGVEARFSEAVEAIKQAVIRKIELHA